MKKMLPLLRAVINICFVIDRNGSTVRQIPQDKIIFPARKDIIKI